MTNCKYCQKVRDDNEDLIYAELNGEVVEAVQIDIRTKNLNFGAEFVSEKSTFVRSAEEN